MVQITMGSFVKAILVLAVALLVALVIRWSKETRIATGQGGFAEPRWIKIGRTFRNALDSGAERGASFVVYHRGELVAEFTGGYADYEANWEMTHNTLISLFSTTKSLGAIVLAHLVSQGYCNYSDNVIGHWPEFAQNGKEAITIEQLLSHHAGLPYIDEEISLFDINDHAGKLGDILARQRPIWAPGSRIAYHGYTMGLYMDQLVRRIDPHHRSLSRYFQEEIAKPLGLDIFIGLPYEENYRCARTTEPDSLWHVWQARRYWPAYWQYLTNASSVVGRELANFEEDKININNPKHRRIESTSGHGFATAQDLAKLFGILANGGKFERQSLLPESVIRLLTEPLATGYDECFSFDITYGRGVTLFKNPTGGYIFGAPGAGGQMGYADPEHQLGWAYLTNHMSLNDIGDDPRYLALQEAMYESVLELERLEKMEGQ